MRGADPLRVQLAEPVADDLGGGDHQGVGCVLVAVEDHDSVVGEQLTCGPYLPVRGAAGGDADRSGVLAVGLSG